MNRIKIPVKLSKCQCYGNKITMYDLISITDKGATLRCPLCNLVIFIPDNDDYADDINNIRFYEAMYDIQGLIDGFCDELGKRKQKERLKQKLKGEQE
ncbi:MAG: hypothetical protein RR420_00915 [Anaerovoracaceae bacterium]